MKDSVIVLHREWQTSTSDIDFDILIDDEDQGQLLSGERRYFRIEPGFHCLKISVPVENNSEDLKDLEFEIQPGEMIVFNVHTEIPIWNGFGRLWAMVFSRDLVSVSMASEFYGIDLSKYPYHENRDNVIYDWCAIP